MKPIFKALMLLSLPLIFVGGVGLYLFASTISEPDKYDVFIGPEAVSPNGKKVATFYTISGGGAAGYVLTRLNLRPQNRKFSATKESDDFVFELRHGLDPSLQWQGNNRLKVVYEAGADTYRKLSEKENVKIIYQAKGVNLLP